MTTYKTVSGDMWDTIAKSQMGGERYMSQLMEANPLFLGTTVFRAGIILNIPEANRKIQKILPPWKQV